MEGRSLVGPRRRGARADGPPASRERRRDGPRGAAADRPAPGRDAREDRRAPRGRSVAHLGEGLLRTRATTGQFGKNHLGDRNEFLPTVHGFDEFYGNLYHLNAEEEPELPDYPKDPTFRAKFGPRGVHGLQGLRRRRPDGRPAVRQGRQAGLQGHRPAGPEADGDDRRRHRRPGRGLHPADEQGRQARVRLGELHPHALPDAHEAREPRPGRALAESVPRHDDRPRQERRPDPQGARRPEASRTTRSSCTRRTTART